MGKRRDAPSTRPPIAHPRLFTEGFWGDDIKQAVQCDDVNFVEAWLEAGNSVDARHEMRGRCTCAMPLIAAAAYDGAERVVRLLIARDADVNALAEGGLGALFNAVCSNYTTIVELLLVAGAKDVPNRSGDRSEDVAEMIAAPVDEAPPHSKGDPTCLRLLQRYAAARAFGGALSREQHIACEVARKQNRADGFGAGPPPRFPKECTALWKGARARIHGLTSEPEGLKVAADGSRRSIGLLNECVAVLLDDGDDDGFHHVSVRFGAELELLRIHRRCLTSLSVRLYKPGERIEYRRHPTSAPPSARGELPSWKAGCIAAVDPTKNSKGDVISVRYGVKLDYGGHAICDHTELRAGQSRLEIAFDAFGADAVARGELSQAALDAASDEVARCGEDRAHQQATMEKHLERWLPQEETSVALVINEYAGQRGVFAYCCDERGRRLRAPRGSKPLLCAVELPGSTEGGILVHPQELRPWQPPATPPPQPPPLPPPQPPPQPPPADDETEAARAAEMDAAATAAADGERVATDDESAESRKAKKRAKKKAKKKKAGAGEGDGEGEGEGDGGGGGGGGSGDGDGGGEGRIGGADGGSAGGNSGAPSENRSELTTVATSGMSSGELPDDHPGKEPLRAAGQSDLGKEPLRAAGQSDLGGKEPLRAAGQSDLGGTDAAVEVSEGAVEVVRQLLESLTAACDEQELRAALLAATPLRDDPRVAAELPEARKRLRDFKTNSAKAVVEPCSICLDGPRTHAFVPCGHRSLCQRCSETRLGSLGAMCPMCRAPFESVIRVYD